MANGGFNVMGMLNAESSERRWMAYGMHLRQRSTWTSELEPCITTTIMCLGAFI